MKENMFRKIPFGTNYSSFSSKVQNLTVFSIIHMIRTRVFGPGELIQKYFRVARYSLLLSLTLCYSLLLSPTLSHSLLLFSLSSCLAFFNLCLLFFTSLSLSLYLLSCRVKLIDVARPHREVPLQGVLPHLLPPPFLSPLICSSVRSIISSLITPYCVHRSHCVHYTVRVCVCS